MPRTFERGEILFREGDTGDTCYVVRSGAVIIRRDHTSGSGRSLTLAEFRTGAFFGELAMFGGDTRSATAETLEDTSVVALLSSDIQRVMRLSPQIAFKMCAGLADRLRDANERLLQQSFQTVSGRVASALLGQVAARQKEEGHEERRHRGARHPGRDRPAGRHLARERQPLSGQPGAGGCRSPRTGKGHGA